MVVQQLEEACAARAGARGARLVAASHVPAALSLLGIVRPGDRLVAFADDFADAFAHGFEGCDIVLVDPPSVAAFTAASEDFDASFDAEGPHLWWFVNSIGGFGLCVPDLRALDCVGFKVVLARGVSGVQLLTDDTEKTKGFYRSLGLLTLPELGCCGFMRP